MRRIVFLNKYFVPDVSATSQILGDLAFSLAESGREVHVVTSRQRYDDPRACLPPKEWIGGVAVHRVATTRFGRGATLGRAVDYLSFFHSARQAVRRLTEPGDILVAKTDPPLLCVPSAGVARRHRLHLVNWLQDLYPEVAVELGVPMVNGPLGKLLFRLRDQALRTAAANVVVGERMAERVRARGVLSKRVHIIPNWCDDQVVRPIAHCCNELRSEWNLQDRFVVAYSGNLGRSHEFETVLTAAEKLRDLPQLLFLFIGGGRGLDTLKRRVVERRLETLFRFLPYQERSRLKHSLPAADAHWLSLRPELEGLIVPSKFYGIAAAGRPTIAITSRIGEVGRLIERHRCGVVVEPGDAERLADCLRHLCARRAELDEMGRHARQMLDAEFTRQHAFARWHDLLAELE